MCVYVSDWFAAFRFLIVFFPFLYPGKPFAYMPYDLRLIEQESHGAAVRPGSPYRLSPREPSKASPQPDASNPTRYSVPPGKQLSHMPCLLYIQTHTRTIYFWLVLRQTCNEK